MFVIHARISLPAWDSSNVPEHVLRGSRTSDKTKLWSNRLPNLIAAINFDQ